MSAPIPSIITSKIQAHSSGGKASSLNLESLLSTLMKDPELKSKSMLTSLRQNAKIAQKQVCTGKKNCLKCFIARRLWMVSVNMYDIMGLLDICPCGTLHSFRPYISYKIKYM